MKTSRHNIAKAGFRKNCFLYALLATLLIGGNSSAQTPDTNSNVPPGSGSEAGSSASPSAGSGVTGRGDQLTLSDLSTFNDDDPKLSQEQKAWIVKKIKEETGLEKPRPMSAKQKKTIARAFESGKASQYSVQELVDAGVFIFRPIANVHPNALKNDEDKSLLPRDGKPLEVDNATWGKQMIPSSILFGVMHSTEDGLADAATTIDIWNKDCAAGKRSSSTPFVLGRCLNGPDIFVTADFEPRWSRHCSSKLTSRPLLTNWSSIGVEMEHSTDQKIDYTEAETKYAAKLWTYIQQRAKLPDNCIITHGEIQGHLPLDHKSYRTDPEGFDWKTFAKEMVRLRKLSKINPPYADTERMSSITKPEQAIVDAMGGARPSRHLEPSSIKPRDLEHN